MGKTGEFSSSCYQEVQITFLKKRISKQFITPPRKLVECSHSSFFTYLLCLSTKAEPSWIHLCILSALIFMVARFLEVLAFLIAEIHLAH